ncbi:hypothetical protein EAE96_005060 [Botrytis aclada]|nr:hypothetical protein EAE96_005060 [Botrytis aclada]
MPKFGRDHAVILLFGLGIVSTVASNFILTRASTRELSQRAPDREKRVNNRADSKHQMKPSRNYSSESMIHQEQGRGIPCTCLPVTSERIIFHEVREIMSHFEEADASDCVGFRRDVLLDKIVERFRWGVGRLSCKTLEDIHESIFEKNCQEDLARKTQEK